MGHMIFPFHPYLLLKYFILYNIMNEYNVQLFFNELI